MIIRHPQPHLPFPRRIAKALLAWIAAPGNLLAVLGVSLATALTIGTVLLPDDERGQDAIAGGTLANCFWTLHDGALTGDDDGTASCGDGPPSDTQGSDSGGGRTAAAWIRSFGRTPWALPTRDWRGDSDHAAALPLR